MLISDWSSDVCSSDLMHSMPIRKLARNKLPDRQPFALRLARMPGLVTLTRSRIFLCSMSRMVGMLNTSLDGIRRWEGGGCGKECDSLGRSRWCAGTYTIKYEKSTCVDGGDIQR